MKEKTAMSLIEYGGGTAEPPPPPPPEEGGEPGGRLRKPKRPVGMGTGGNPAAAAARPSFTGPNRLKYGLKPGAEPGAFVQPGGRDPGQELLRSGGMDREMTADDVLDAYKAALAGGGKKYMPHVSRMGGAVGMPNIGRPRTPGMESEARKIANLLLDGTDEEVASLVSEAKVRVAQEARPRSRMCSQCGKRPAFHPSDVCQDCEAAVQTHYDRAGDRGIGVYTGRPKPPAHRRLPPAHEDCGVKYPGHGLSTKGKGKKAKTVAKSPGKVSYGKK